MKKCIFVFLASFIFFVGVFTPVHVAAYTDLNGYPFVMDNMSCERYSINDDGSYRTSDGVSGTLKEQNSYLFDFYDSLDKIGNIRIGNLYSSLVIPLNLDIYDYYLVGTVGVNSGEFSDIAGCVFYQYVNGELQSSLIDITSLNFNSLDNFTGQNFYGKITNIENGNLSYIQIIFNNRFTMTGDLWFSASIVPIAKSSDANSIMNSILQKLTEINNNLISTNQILTQHDSNVGSWFSDLKTSMQSAFATLFGKVDSGFYALYQQMTNEQDEKLNGYDGTVASGANNEFQTGAEDLTQIEGQLNTNSTTYVNDFTSSGFDTSILTTLGSSLTFVVTWFTNFWNMGGIWTVGLSTCFAIWIAFYILRTRSK